MNVTGYMIGCLDEWKCFRLALYSDQFKLQSRINQNLQYHFIQITKYYNMINDGIKSYKSVFVMNFIKFHPCEESYCNLFRMK
jgi:hypothetical protein